MKEKERYLPIYVGFSQGRLVGRELQGIGYSELDNYAFSMTGIDIANSKVESVIINLYIQPAFAFQQTMHVRYLAGMLDIVANDSH